MEGGDRLQDGHDRGENYEGRGSKVHDDSRARRARSFEELKCCVFSWRLDGIRAILGGSRVREDICDILWGARLCVFSQEASCGGRYASEWY